MNRITVAKVAAYTIAGIAAVSSYGHQVRLLGLADIEPLFGIIPGEWLTPLTVDSLAIVGLAVRGADVTEKARRWALLPIVLAGGLAIAANVAMAKNLVQFVVGIWTVLAYVVAELFVQKLERKQAPVAPKLTKVARVTEAEKAARKRAGYRDMSSADKAAWTKQYRERQARKAPTSPGRVPVNAPSAEELEERFAS